MANPLFKNFGGQGQTPTQPTGNLGNLGGLGNLRNIVKGTKDIKSLFRLVKSGGNPQVFLQELLSRNPQLVKQITPFLNGSQDPKQFVMEYCKQNNITPDDLMQQIGLLD